MTYKFQQKLTWFSTECCLCASYYIKNLKSINETVRDFYVKVIIYKGGLTRCVNCAHSAHGASTISALDVCLNVTQCVDGRSYVRTRFFFSFRRHVSRECDSVKKSRVFFLNFPINSRRGTFLEDLIRLFISFDPTSMGCDCCQPRRISRENLPL